MPYKDPAKRNASQKEYYERNRERLKEQRKEIGAKYYEKNKDVISAKRKECYDENREKKKEYYQQNKERICDQKRVYYDAITRNTYESILSGKIIDRHKWDLWCNAIKIDAKRNKYPYSDDFVNDVMFDMMRQGCFYCEDIAMTIDRIDSKLEHTPDNCVASCHRCNMSKGVADPSTFMRKAYYRARGKYYDDDTDIWFVNKQRPRIDMYNTRAKKQEVSFDLTKEDFDMLTKGDCEYCERSPITWFGVDRGIPSLGYVIGNVVSCCFDCNVDKLNGDVESMFARNKRIADRVDAGELIITECEKVKLNKNKK